MILTHGANSIVRGGGGVTPPEGYELIRGVYGSYNGDIWFNGYNAPPALSGKTNSDIEMEVELFIRNAVSPNYESQIFATSDKAGRIYIKGNNDGTGFRIGALSGDSNYTPTYIETDISVAIGTKLTITLSQDTLTVKYGTSVLSSSSIPYTNVSINDVIILFYPNNDAKPYAISHAVIRDKTSGQNLVDIYPLKKISDGSCYCWDVTGNVFKGVNLYEYQTVDIGGRKYPVVKIGNQLWMAENLDYKFKYNGSTLPVGGSGTPSTPAAWYYNNNETDYGIDGTYKCGLLYNGYAAKYLNDNKVTLLPEGWHIPTSDEWTTLANSVGSSTAGTKLKALDGSAGNNWPSGWNGTDDYGFKALPAGSMHDEMFANLDVYANFWSSTVRNSSSSYGVYFDSYSVMNSGYYGYLNAISVRLVKDAT